MAVMKHPMKTINKVFLTLTVCIFIGYSMSVEAGEIVFTQGEKDFIDAANNLRVVSVDGIAPLSYIDSKGGIKGIGIDLFDEVSALTGLNFEFELYESTAAALASGFDIFTNMEKKYAPEGMLLSQPYLESETVLFYNKSLDPKQL